MKDKDKTGEIPVNMLSVRQLEVSGDLKVEEIPVPQPGPGEVLIRMAYAPINPSDLATIDSGYMQTEVPLTPGFEGSGIVVKAGKGWIASLRKGKRVACSPVQGKGGTWAEYMVTPATRCFPLPSNVSLKEGSMMLVNPMTAAALVDIARKGGHKAMVNDAAASSLGKMLIRLCKKNHIPLINVVTRENHVLALEELGADHILLRSDDDFKIKLIELTHKLNATLLLDAVSGEQAAELIEALPSGSKCISYANLSGSNLSVNPRSLYQDQKRLEGFQLANWLSSKSLLFTVRFLRKVAGLLPDVLYSTISNEYPIEDIEEALQRYRTHMSEGKILLKL